MLKNGPAAPEFDECEPVMRQLNPIVQTNLVIVMDRTEIVAATCHEDNPVSVVLIRVEDTDSGKITHFNVKIGITRGRPFLDVLTGYRSEQSQKVKRIVANWPTDH